VSRIKITASALDTILSRFSPAVQIAVTRRWHPLDDADGDTDEGELGEDTSDDANDPDARDIEAAKTFLAQHDPQNPGALGKIRGAHEALKSILDRHDDALEPPARPDMPSTHSAHRIRFGHL
jgi:hypothetical protein